MAKVLITILIWKQSFSIYLFNVLVFFCRHNHILKVLFLLTEVYSLSLPFNLWENYWGFHSTFVSHLRYSHQYHRSCMLKDLCQTYSFCGLPHIQEMIKGGKTEKLTSISAPSLRIKYKYNDGNHTFNFLIFLMKNQNPNP